MAGYVVSWADPYQELRKVLDPRYARLSPEELEDLFDRTGVPAEELESFLGTVQRIGQGVVGALPQVLPGVLPVVGTALGGPVGGALGAVAGQAVGQALTPGRPAQLVATPQPAQPVGAPQPAPAAAPQAPPVVPSAAPSAPSAAQLLQTMFRPETLMALISMVMGQAGRQTIPVGGTPVPVGAFANTLEVLAGEAAAEHSTLRAGGHNVSRYLRDFAGEVAVDPAVPEHRAARLLELLDDADDPGWGGQDSWRGDGWLAWRPGEPVPDDEDDQYEELEMAELDDELTVW